MKLPILSDEILQKSLSVLNLKIKLCIFLIEKFCNGIRRNMVIVLEHILKLEQLAFLKFTVFDVLLVIHQFLSNFDHLIIVR